MLCAQRGVRFLRRQGGVRDALPAVSPFRAGWYNAARGRTGPAVTVLVSTEMEARRSFAWLLAVCTLGCVSAPIGNVDWTGKSATAIVIEGERNLGDVQVRITDPDEIQRILTLVKRVRRGFAYARVNVDTQRSEVIRIRIVRDDGTSDITMVSGLMPVPGSKDGLVYDPGSKPQSELWALLLARLKSGNA